MTRRPVGFLALLAAFVLLLNAAWETGVIDGRHVLAVLLFAAGSSLILHGPEES